VINEPTASVFILRRNPERGWLMALVWHPRLQCWLPAGGHVEPDETPAQAAVRETLEEAGLDVALVPDPSALAPAAFPQRLVPAPWLVAEVPASFSELAHFLCVCPVMQLLLALPSRVPSQSPGSGRWPGVMRRARRGCSRR
jgi:8-oxo-dGTP pyrophosphatase MutT (NUDIX family)